MTASWIAGLMRENYEAVGFIPQPTIEQQYLRQHRFVLQCDERGQAVGYLLYGALRYGSSVSIAQHCIQHDSRLYGYGEAAFRVVRDRAEQAGSSAIVVRCATDLDSLAFWRAQGFVLRGIEPGGKTRQRQIARLVLPLRLPLLEESGRDDRRT